jgi:predicted nucleotidyltransferase
MPPARGSTARGLQEQRDAILDLARAHKGRSAAVFESVARGEDTADSDIDLLVDFEPTSSPRDLIALEEDLERLLGTSVDVISAGGLLDRDIDIRCDAVPL